MPSEALAFLTDTSILEELSGELCDVVLGTTGSGLALRAAAASNLLVAPLDRGHSRYRCHPLLREVAAGGALALGFHPRLRDFTAPPHAGSATTTSSTGLCATPAQAGDLAERRPAAVGAGAARHVAGARLRSTSAL